MYTITIGHGALCDAPVWEDHSRGKNWFARIWIDPSKPSGLGREFARVAYGREFFYLVPGWLKPGIAVEFGGDYYSGSGRRQPSRWYGVIIDLSATEVIFEEYDSSRQAIRAAEQFLNTPENIESFPVVEMEPAADDSAPSVKVLQ